MDSFIRTYIINTGKFEDDTFFGQAAESISPYRRQKIALLKNRKDKNRSIAAALALDTALKEYGLEERLMEYDLGEQGKPYFRYHPEICFSLSHSGSYAICSIGAYAAGNDIEHARKGSVRIAERFFAKEELDWIHRVESPADMEERVLRIWTMKESFLKVTGKGMSLPLQDFVILMEPGVDTKEFKIRHNVNDKTYYIKEYDMPEIFKESGSYKISVCSEDSAFETQLRVIE